MVVQKSMLRGEDPCSRTLRRGWRVDFGSDVDHVESWESDVGNLWESREDLNSICECRSSG